MQLSKLSLTGNNLIIPGQGGFLVGEIQAWVGKNDNLFYSVIFYPEHRRVGLYINYVIQRPSPFNLQNPYPTVI
jgi:hypothetical protein